MYVHTMSNNVADCYIGVGRWGWRCSGTPNNLVRGPNIIMKSRCQSTKLTAFTFAMQQKFQISNFPGGMPPNTPRSLRLPYFSVDEHPEARIVHGRTERSDYNEDELARACLARETAEQKERLRDRAWRDAQASSNRDQGNTARKKRD